MNPARTIIVEVETVIRSAQKGEWVLGIYGIEQCPGYDHNRYRGYIVRRFVQGPEGNASYPDLDGDGVPDAFANRPSITEVLNGT